MRHPENNHSSYFLYGKMREAASDNRTEMILEVLGKALSCHVIESIGYHMRAFPPL